MIEREVIVPEGLLEGDPIAILAPASAVKREYVDGAAEFLRRKGFRVRVMPSAVSEPCGSYSAPEERRVGDFLEAWGDPEVKCVFCARGGYGCIHLLSSLSRDFLRENAKWLVGFSDVSALHAALNDAGVVSLHGPMCKHLATRPEDDSATVSLLRMLSGELPAEIVAEGNAYNRPGSCRGRLIGGNLAVLNGLAGTPWDMLGLPVRDPEEGYILFIEDISEAIYAVERMMFRLRMSGTLGEIKGLIIGLFTEYRADRNFGSMEEMLDFRLRQWGVEGIPVAFDYPCGHIETNMPLAVSSEVVLTVR